MSWVLSAVFAIAVPMALAAVLLVAVPVRWPDDDDDFTWEEGEE